jgi:hypothetical protein
VGASECCARRRGGERTGDAAATAEVSIGGRGGDRDRGRRQVRESCGETSGAGAAGARGHHIVVHAHVQWML